MQTTKQAMLIGTADAARMLGVTPRTVTRMALDGRLVPAYRSPNGVLFRLSTVQRYLDSQR